MSLPPDIGPDIEINQTKHHPRCPPVPVDAKISLYIYKKSIENKDTQKWYQLSEGSQKEIVKAIP